VSKWEPEDWVMLVWVSTLPLLVILGIVMSVTS
jgi:hypothetical protein